MGEPESSHLQYNRLAGVEREAPARVRQTHCWVLRERVRLLGPDSSGWAILTSNHPTATAAPGRRRTRGGTRPNVENCIVDASIFNDLVIEIGICGKLLRAHGGCLGIRNR